MTEIKICEDCKFYALPPRGYSVPRCTHPMTGRHNLVRRGNAWFATDCDDARQYSHSCGKEARFFEQRDGPLPVPAHPLARVFHYTRKSMQFLTLQERRRFVFIDVIPAILMWITVWSIATCRG